jgi:hypothetical protein
MGLLLGHQEGTHNYRIWDGNKVIITRDVIFPIISGDDFQNSGDDTFSARIDLSKSHKVSDQTDNVSTNFQPDSIKTAARKISGDGIFYIQSKERNYNFDDFLGDFRGVLERNRHHAAQDHFGVGGHQHTPPQSPDSSVQNASPPISSDSESDSVTSSDDPLALTDTEDPFSYLAHALTASAPSSYREAKASGEPMMAAVAPLPILSGAPA